MSTSQSEQEASKINSKDKTKEEQIVSSNDDLYLRQTAEFGNSTGQTMETEQ